jgi:GTP pyrophosphokinase
MNRLEEAIDLAVEAHAGDEDKAGATYIRHPLRVMEQVDTEDERIAAVLHDVVEDSEQTLSSIESRFGADIRDAVDALTKRDEESYLDEFIPRCAENEIARRVKQADIRDNMDLTRLPEVDEDTVQRQIKYHRALRYLEAHEQ